MSQKYLPGQPQQLPRHNNKLAHYKADSTASRYGIIVYASVIRYI